VAVLGVALAAGGAWQGLLVMVFLAAVLWAEEIVQAALKALSAARGAVRERARQRRELNLKRLELEAALARRARPVPCAHEHPEDVRDLAGTLVARLCPACEAQLPPDFEASKGDR
jgi:hypothetical protein